jgi:hypothetical protein
VRNARKIPQATVDKVAASIREFGWQQPIVVDTDGVIVAGHVRLLAAKQLGEKQVPVQVAAGLTPGQIKAYRLLDNRSHQESGWDTELLAPEIAELQALNIDVTLTGFDPTRYQSFSPPVLPMESRRSRSRSSTRISRRSTSARNAAIAGAALPDRRPKRRRTQPTDHGNPRNAPP